MKTTNPLTIRTITLFFPLALALAGLTGCAAAADGSDPELGATEAAGSGSTAEPVPERTAIAQAGERRAEDAVSHVDDAVPGTGGTPHEGPTTIGQPHRQE